ncbi:hypothetical protein BT69DRAFT_1341230 [Atractiella rhizophila]|nr:hypothetical protein BT69DRAFT_1341230 [Atractiella rhizophila]
MTADLNHSMAPRFGRSVIRKSRFGGMSTSPLVEEEGPVAGPSGERTLEESRLAEKKNEYERAYQRSVAPSFMASQVSPRKKRPKKAAYIVDEASSIDEEDYQANMFASSDEPMREIDDDADGNDNHYLNLLANVPLGTSKW